MGAGQRDGADDDAGGAGCDTDADHIAGTGDHALGRIRRDALTASSCRYCRPHRRKIALMGCWVRATKIIAMVAQKAEKPGEKSFDQDAPDQHHDGQKEMQSRSGP